MPRRPRVQYPGAIYHVMARGNRRDAIFVDSQDREIFLEAFDEVCARSKWEVYAFVLMTNHYHLAIRTPEPNLSDGMKWLQNTYTRRFNSRHRGWGRLFGDRYKSELVETAESRTSLLDYCPSVDTGPPPRNEKARHLKTLIDYIHLNPARARIVDVDRRVSTTEELTGLASYEWSSLTQGYLVSPSKRPSWLMVDRGFSFVGHRDTAQGRRDYVKRLEETIRREHAEGTGIETGESDQADHERELLRLEGRSRRWIWGSDDFATQVRKGFFESEEAGSQKLRQGIYRSSEAAHEGACEEALSLIAKGEAFLGLDDVKNCPRGDLRRAAIGWAVWTQVTGIEQGWLAEQLGLNLGATVSAQISRFRNRPTSELPTKILEWKEHCVRN